MRIRSWFVSLAIGSVWCLALSPGEPPAGKAPPEEPGAQAEEGPVLGPLDTEKGRGPHTENWEPYLELVECKYLSPSTPEEGQVVELKFNLSTDVAKDTVITFALNYLGNTYVETDYRLESEVRKGLVLKWKAPMRLVTGDYFVSTRIQIDKQKPAVLKHLRKMAKRFPPEYEPWQYLYMKEGHIVVSGELEERAEKEELCAKYTAFLEELVENMNEFVDQMEAAKEGKAFVTAGGSLDVQKLTDFIVAWRKKQGETQRKILLFQDTDRGLYLKSGTAHVNLLELARMVSKRSWQLQNEVTEKYGVKPINPAADKFFDRNYRYRVDADALAKRYEKVLSLACPEEEAAEPSEEAKEGEGGETPAPEAETQKEEPPPEKEKSAKPAPKPKAAPAAK